MTEVEPRIIEFLRNSDAPRPPADLPDRLLSLLEADRPEQLGHEVITAASSLNVHSAWRPRASPCCPRRR